MNSIKEDVKQMQQLIAGAYHQVQTLSAQTDAEKLQHSLEKASGQMERSTLILRRLCEAHSPGVGGYGNRPVLPRMETSGFVEQFGYGWLHIQLNTLLPHCRYQTPEWLSDTIRRLLDDYEAGGSKLPFFQKAMLVIDEYCGADGRHIFDQDNKGWKAVSNAIKGRLIPDDDQFTMTLALLSEKSELNICHITLLDMADAADFFSFRSGDYAASNFYNGDWER